MSLSELAAVQDGVLTRAQVLASGYERRHIDRRVAAGDWCRLWRGVYLTSAGAYERPPRAALLRAAVLVGGADAVLAYGAAVEAYDLPGPTSEEVDVLLPRTRRPGPPVASWPLRPRWHWRAVSAHERTTAEGLPVTSVTRTAGDVVPRWGEVDAVVLLDAALHRGLLRVEELSGVVAAARGSGARRLAASRVALVRPGSESPLETRVRLICVAAGLEPDQLQFPVVTANGRVLGYGDMAWHVGDRTLIVECDGVAFHGSPEALHRDRIRQNDLVLAGCVLLRFTWRDSERPGYLVGVVRRALQELGWSQAA